ncbi:MAG: hypothetical protein J1F28_01335 [Oscillospiraceae bacterium]|nr:hypothetical protein [Oscillospiraceae bacterium]
MHTFRKYISNRGSALFMVISTLTALMITCMAMYFTVLASRSTTYAIFNQKQSYQTSLSLYQMIVNDSMSNLGKKIVNMGVNEEITATIDSGEFSELGGEFTITVVKLEINNLGAAGTEHIFDIIITSTVNGISETVHSQSRIVVPPDGDGVKPNPSVSPTFAATGYVPNDVYLDMGRFKSDVYFDNEITYFGAYSGSELFLNGDINCAGSVVVKNGKAWKVDSEPIVFAVRNMLTIEGGNPMEANDGSKIYVGGDMFLYRNIKNYSVFVNGDLHIYEENQNARFYVNGDIYIHTYCNPSNNYWCNGTIYDDNNKVSSQGTWDDKAASDPNVMTVNEMIGDLDRRTQTNPYYKWIIDEDAIPEVKLGSGGNHQTIVTDSNGVKPVYIVHKDAYNSSNNPYGNDADLDAKWKTGCVIDDIIVNANKYFYIIIDTGDDESNTYTIRVQPNRTDSNGNKTLFSWSGEKGDSIRPIILVKGRGTVVIDVPAGVTYQDTDYAMMCHYNWWVMCGGKVPSELSNTDDSQPATNLLRWDILNNYILKNTSSCNYSAVCTGCGLPYSNGHICVSASSYLPNVELCTRSKVGGVICNEPKVTVECSEHGYKEKYCPTCEYLLVEDEHGNYNICVQHVDKNALNGAFGSYSGKLNVDTSGNPIYPTTNIYLISSEESADIRFGHKPDGSDVTKNTMIGYVYAPYVTFFAAGGDTGNDSVKFMGGMTVSDYVFFSAQTFLMCKPEKNPMELMGKDSFGSAISGNKSWKIELISH